MANVQKHNICVTNSIWNKKELPDQWQEYIIVPIYKKGDKIDCRNYCGISVTKHLSDNFPIQNGIK
jgi:hypothetical protein